MNPISGTFRHPAGGATAASLTEFLSSTKETEELFMVVDEELKMMSAVCSDGGRITGPHLKDVAPHAHRVHAARPQHDGPARHPARDDVRAHGHRVADAERLHRHPTAREDAARLLLRRRGTVHPAAGDTHDLDAPILIRTAYLEDGRLRVPVGATLVRHSDPDGEVGETHGKAAGVLGAIGAIARDEAAERAALDEDAPALPKASLADDPAVATLLAARNERLAPFWLNPQNTRADDDVALAPGAGRTALVVDAEDRFTTMLAHQLRHLGFAVEIAPWNVVQDAAIDAPTSSWRAPGPAIPATTRTRASHACETSSRVG
jgi:phenazine biosynthesis protein phzE